MGRDSVRKFSVNLVRLLYRSVCKHPFLVGLLCFVLFLYKSFPLLLSILVTASPVLVCTAVLLATLLSFGQPNIPEIEKEEEVVTREIASFLRAGVAENATVVERDVSFATEETVEGGSSVGTEDGKIENVFGTFVDNVLLVDDESREDKYERRGVEVGERQLGDLGLEKEGEISEEASTRLETEGVASDVEETEDVYSLIGKGIDENLDGEEIENLYTLIGQGRDEDHDGEEIENRYSLIGQGSGGNHDGEEIENRGTWLGRGRDENHDGEEIENWGTWLGRERDVKHEEETDNLLGELGSHTLQQVDSEEEDDVEYSSDESDGAESSSPDASLADIIPLLDELHPLLDEDAPQPVHSPHDDSETASERSSGSHDDIIESDEDSEDKEEEVDDDDEEEEASTGEKGDASTSPIIWTEDDHKNVMDLGTSEIERNQRLESLIARRKARKAVTMMKHKDLIDFDSDLLFNVPHIATRRRNPFDGPDESYGDMGLPPIPGSAPSILVPRRNPFDIPYDSSEEKPDLKGDSFEEEFAGFQQKESAIFRRHESFSLGPSTLGGHRRQKQDIKWRPFFVAEGLASEGTSYSSLHRQLSEISDAKTSSVPDTESVITDQDDIKLSDLSQERELMPHSDHATDHASQESQSSDDADSVHIEEIVERDTNHDEVEIAMRDLQIHQTAEAEDAATMGIRPTTEVGDAAVLEIFPTTEVGDAATPMELGMGEVNLKPDFAEDDSGSRSSMPSLSKMSELVSDVNREGITELESKGILMEESVVSEHSSLEESEFKQMTEVADDGQQQKEPVYDSTPSPVEKLLSFTSISSEIAFSPASEEATAQFTDKEFGMRIENRAMDIPSNEVASAASSQTHELDENVLMSKEAVEVSDHDDGKGGSTEAEKDSDNPDELDQLASSNMDAEIHVVVNQSVDEKNCEVSSNQIPSEDLTWAAHEEPLPSVVVEHFSAVYPNLSSSEAETAEEPALDVIETHHVVQDQIYSSISLDNRLQEERKNEDGLHLPSLDAEVDLDVHEKTDSVVVEQLSMVNPSSLETDHVEDHLLDKQEAPKFEQEEVHSSSYNANVSACLHPDLDVKVVSQSSYEDAPSEETCIPVLEKQPTWSDKSMVEPCFDDHHELQEPSSVQTDIMDAEEGITDYVTVTVPEFHDSEEEVSTSPDSILNQSKTSDYESSISRDVLKDEDEGQVQASGIENSSSVPYQTHIPEANINVEEDDKKEIDEGLLSELDRVGDFWIEEVESLPTEMIQAGNEDRAAEIEPLDNERNVSDTNMELPDLEARSVEDIEMAFKQLHEGVDIEEGILLSSFQEELDMGNSEETISNSTVINARSMDDIHMVMKEVFDGSAEDKVSSTDDFGLARVDHAVEETTMVTLDEPVDGLDEASDNSDFEVIDARCIEDIHVVLKEVSDGSLGESVEPVDSKDGLAEVEVDKVSSTKDLNTDRVEQPDVEETGIVCLDESVDEHDEATDNSNFHVIHARSVDDMHVTVEEISDGNMGESSEPLESKDALSEAEVGKVSFIEDLDAVRVEPNVEETNTSVLDKPVDGLEDSSDNSNFQYIDARSMGGIHVDLKEVSDDNLGKSPEQLDSKDGLAAVKDDEVSSKDGLAEVKVDEVSFTEDLGSVELETEGASMAPLDEASVNSNFQVSDIRAAKDIHKALKEVSDGIIGKSPELLDSKDGLAEVEVDKVSSTENFISARVEPDVTSMICLDKSLKEVSDSNMGKSSKSLDSDGLEEVEVDKASPAKDLDLAKVEPNVEETSMVALDKPADGLVEASDSSTLKQKGKKVRSHQSSSSSSSSPSSSSSDSD